RPRNRWHRGLPVDVAPPEAERWGQGGRRIPVYVGTGPNGRALCNWCAVEVTPPRRKWCSDDCRETARSRTWAHIVERIRERDHNCRSCGRVSGPFEIHHITPIAEGGDDRPDNLRLLCTRCHRRITA